MKNYWKYLLIIWLLNSILIFLLTLPTQAQTVTVTADVPLTRYNFTKTYKTVAEREGWIKDYLARYPEEYLSNQEIENLIAIMKKENTQLDPNVNSRNIVCFKYGWCETDGLGLFQILASTYKLKGYGCEGEPRTATLEQQLDCGVKVYKKSGYWAWFNSSKALHII